MTIGLDQEAINIVNQESTDSAPAQKVLELLKSTIIPGIEFEETNIQDALNYLTQVAAKQDPQKRGVNFMLNVKSTDPVSPITLRLKQVSLLHALDAVALLAGLTYKIESDVVIVGAK